jgi:hypothetical protein
VRIWDLATGSCITTFPVFDAISAVAVFDGGLVVAAGPRLLCLDVAQLHIGGH